MKNFLNHINIKGTEYDLVAQTGEYDTSVVLNSEGGNSALSDLSVAEGQSTIAGCKGFYIRNLDIANQVIHLTTEECNPTFNENYFSSEQVDLSKYAINDYIDITAYGYYRWVLCSKIQSIDGNKIIYSDKIAENSKPLIPELDTDKVPYIFSVPTKPKAGAITFAEGAHASGENTIAAGAYSHAEGSGSIATGQYSHAEGLNTLSGYAAHAEGSGTKAINLNSHSEGYQSTASGVTSHAEGSGTQAIGNISHAEGFHTIAKGVNSHAEGKYTTAGGASSHAEGLGSDNCGAWGDYSHVEGNLSHAEGMNSHAEGQLTKATGETSHAEGYNTEASGLRSHAEGRMTKAYGEISHAEGSGSLANGARSHAEGFYTQALFADTHAEGYYTIAGSETNGQGAHAEGMETKATGKASHAEGRGTLASGEYQHIQGKWNVEDIKRDTAGNAILDSEGKTQPANTYAHIVGNGTNQNKRSNAHTLDWKGNAWFAGQVASEKIVTKLIASESSTKQVTIDGTLNASGNITINNKDVATEKYVQEQIDNIAQVDWNESDKLSAAFIKNRTHYLEKGVEEVLEKSDIFFNGVLPIGGMSVETNSSEEDAEGNIISIRSFDALPGDKMIAHINGQELTGTVELQSEIDNKQILFVDFNNKVQVTSRREYQDDMPYYFVTISQSTGAKLPLEIYYTNVIVEGKEDIYHPLDKRYLPKDLYITAGQNNSYRLGKQATAEGNNTVAAGICSHAEGTGTVAESNYSHAEGDTTIASGYTSHAEGSNSRAVGNTSHAEGSGTRAEGNYSHAEGRGSIAAVLGAHAEGGYTKAEGRYTHASGLYTQVKGLGATVVGINNKIDAPINGINFNAKNNIFIVGNGSVTGANSIYTAQTKSNAFRVDLSGNVYAANTSMSTGADYAEYFEWSDGNLNGEDRIGRFVTLEQDKIKLANPNDEILGVISGHASVIGDAHEDSWNGMYDRDIYGRLQYEEVEVEYEEEDEDGNTIVHSEIETHIKLNPNYDPTQIYIPRSERPEWDAVGFMGKLVVIDDGSCAAGSKCTCGVNGIATTSNTGYYVLKRLDETHIQILLK